ncbi:hypothetical protein MBLNU230_g4919t1 [Neophaeotheca triangularis]
MASKRSRAAFEADNKAGSPAHAPYALYGTPLPAFDPERREDGSKVPLWQQQATDEQGRKRFHGAFTGGYSAGYFNSVGSAEGFTPKAWVSSRSQKKEDGAKDESGVQGYSLDDVMDEEDKADRDDAQKLETTGSFAGLGAGVAGGKDPRAQGMFSDLFKSTGETMGVKLLQRMGWRHGEGVGPKVKRRAQGDKDGPLHEFAPQDTEIVSFERKTNQKGLGFAGEAGLNAGSGSGAAGAGDGDDSESGDDARMLRANRSKISTKPKKSKVSGLGMGVLNDTGSDDDDDPYAMGPKLSFNRTIGGKKKKRTIGLGSGDGSPAPSVVKPTKSRGPALRGFRKCHDNRLPLDGFILSVSTLDLNSANSYPPPTVPPGWVSSRLNSSAADPTKTYLSTAEAAKASTLDPKARAKALGQQALPGKSVFDYMSPAARERLATASGKSNLPQAKSEKVPDAFETLEAQGPRSLWSLVPPLDATTANEALQRGRAAGWPYEEDLPKQRRYRYYLELRAGKHSDLPSRPADLPAKTWGDELEEFADAAHLYKPLTQGLASRFERSSGFAGETGAKTSNKPENASSSSSAKARHDEPAREAAKLGMYGRLTRTVYRFDPGRIVCKRFGVAWPGLVDYEETENFQYRERGNDENVGCDGPAGAGQGGSTDMVVLNDDKVKPKSFVSGGTEGVLSGVEEGLGQVSVAGGLYVPGKLDGGGEKAWKPVEGGERAVEEVMRGVFGDAMDES